MHQTFAKPTSRAEAKADRRNAAKRNQRMVYAIVTARDGRKCRACKRSVDPNATDMLRRAHHHHVVFRSAGGKDETGTLMLACARCHADIHAHRMTVIGNADGTLTFSTETHTWQS